MIARSTSLPGFGRGARPVALLVAAVAIGVAMLLGVVAAQGPVLAVALASMVGAATAIVLWPDAATLIGIAMLYSNAAVVGVTFHELPTFVGAAVPLLFVLPLARSVISHREPIVVTPATRWLIPYLLVVTLSTIFAELPSSAEDDLITFALEGAGLYFLLTNVIRTWGLLRQVIWVLLLVGGVIGAISVFQQLTGSFGNIFFGFGQISRGAFSLGGTGADLQPRLAGMIGEQNRYAQVMLMLVPLGIFTMLSEERRSLRVTAGVLTALIGLGMVLTFSRGAAIAVVVLLGAMIALRAIRPRTILALVLTGALAFAVVPEYSQRLGTLDDLASLVAEDSSTSEIEGSIRSRATEMMAAFLVFADHPIVGVGPGQFPAYYQEYADLVALRVKSTDRQAHNLYVGLAAEIGILGLICFVMVVTVTLRDLLIARRRARDRPERANMAAAFLLVIISYLVTGMFLHFAFVRYFWLMLALAGAAAVIIKREASTENGSAPAVGSSGAAGPAPGNGSAGAAGSAPGTMPA